MRRRATLLTGNHHTSQHSRHANTHTSQSVAVTYGLPNPLLHHGHHSSRRERCVFHRSSRHISHSSTFLRSRPTIRGAWRCKQVYMSVGGRCEGRRGKRRNVSDVCECEELYYVYNRTPHTKTNKQTGSSVRAFLRLGL